MSVGGGDAGDAIGVPDVGVDLAFDVFELVCGAGDAPAFAVVVELADDAQGEAIEDEADVGLPSPLEEVWAQSMMPSPKYCGARSRC